MFYVVSVRYSVYRYCNVWFQFKTCECLVPFKFLSMSCMGSFQWPFHYKKLLLSNKNICWATYLCSCNFFVSFSRAVNYIFFFTYLFFMLHSSISVQEKKIMIILLCFKCTRASVFTICPTVMLNIGHSSISCLEKNTDVHQKIQTLEQGCISAI